MVFLAFRQDIGLDKTPSLPAAHSLNGHSTAHFPQLKQPFYIQQYAEPKPLFKHSSNIMWFIFSVTKSHWSRESTVAFQNRDLLLISSCDFTFSHHGFYYGYFDLLIAVLWDFVHIRRDFFAESGSKSTPWHIKPLLHFLLLHYSMT